MSNWEKQKRMTQRDQVDEANWEGRFAAIEKEADAILEREGDHHVRGCFFSSVDDATMARMGEAERIVAARESAERIAPITERQMAELVAIRSVVSSKLQTLFDASPNCEVCGVAIETIDKATIFTPEGGKDALIHDAGTCFGAMLERSIGRYMNRGRILEMRVES